METKIVLQHTNMWRGVYKNTSIKILGRDKSTNIYSGGWWYYIFIHEKDCPNFESIWLPEEVSQFSENSPKRFWNNYLANETLASVEMHGGITFYKKHGYAEGDRCVEIGCDFQHLWDESWQYSLEHVLNAAMRTVDDLFEKKVLTN